MKKHIEWDIIKGSITFAFSAIGSVWTALEIIDIFPFSVDFLNMVKDSSFIILMIAGLAGGFGKLLYSVCRIFFQTFHKEDKTITIRIGNILKKKGGEIIVGVNEQLITDSTVIGPSSIHKQLTGVGGRRTSMDAIFKKQKEKADRGQAKHDFFQGIVGDKHIIFLPMSSLNAQQVVTTTSKMVSGKLTDLFNNQGLLQIENQTVFCPLLGTGEAGMHLSKEETIKMIVRIFITCCGNMTSVSIDKIKHLEIVVYWKDFWEIDWTMLNRELKFIISNCDKCVN